MIKKKIILCSACLLGIKCRYDGKSKPNKKIIELSKKTLLIPICPEQLGGLTTPRELAEQKGNKVFTKSGKDVTENFLKGAKEALKVVRLFDVKEAVLKQRSPSCGCGQIHDGTFSNIIIKGDGVTAALLKRNRIKVISDEDFK
jgi:uncharacterized protein YbbK (DUF523 family)